MPLDGGTSPERVHASRKRRTTREPGLSQPPCLQHKTRQCLFVDMTPVHDPAANSPDQPVHTILVVEDEILLRIAIVGYLQDCGYRVYGVGSAAKAKTVLDAVPVDLLFSDVSLEGEENGFMLASWTRQHHPDVQVLLTSGVANAAKRASDLCDDSPMPKPYAHEAVLQRIRELLRKAKEAGAR